MASVIWNLSYPIATPDQLAVFRHHFETLRLDSHVSAVEASERTDRPYVMTMRVEFSEGFDRPDSQELRFADTMYPSQMRHFERDIHVSQPATPELAHETLRRLQFELPRISGMSSADVVERMRDVATALWGHDVSVLARPPSTGFMEPIVIPRWLAVGRAYRLKADPTTIATLKRVHVNPGAVLVELYVDGGHTRHNSLDEFVSLFEPYDRPALPRTAWARVLDDFED